MKLLDFRNCLHIKNMVYYSIEYCIFTLTFLCALISKWRARKGSLGTGMNLT